MAGRFGAIIAPETFSGETGRIGGQATSGTSPGTHPEAIPLRIAARRGKVPLAGKRIYGCRAEAQFNNRRGHGQTVNDRPTGSERQTNCNRMNIILPLGEGGRECAKREDCACSSFMEGSKWRRDNR